MTIAIPLTEERAEQLRMRAIQAGLAPEEFLRRSVEQFLDQPDEHFQQAADYVLKKNAELYRRLA
jgi:antitoxin FitA